MSRHIRTLPSLAAATALLCVLTATASANHLSINSRTIRATWNELDVIPPVGETARCLLTLEGSFHSASIAKTSGALIGYITRATIPSSSCTGILEVTVQQASLPWHVRYRGFQGTLPNITDLQTSVIGAAFLVEGTFGIECLYLTTAADPLVDNYSIRSGHSIVNSEVGGEIRSENGCGIFGEHIRLRFRGTSSTISQLGSTAGITVTLI
jgi:hypothetical protein